jgi:hypothetical protein
MSRSHPSSPLHAGWESRRHGDAAAVRPPPERAVVLGRRDALQSVGLTLLLMAFFKALDAAMQRAVNGDPRDPR